ncbi:hypothetical protein [Streptomyces avicenniae]|uniref:hypothetical protein n=1 Tax=Streptomyces avicenniae TaxID=500153 RepID=UPI00167E2A18|nr:hypothetical protein [Streptomyces avicenniae]
MRNSLRLPVTGVAALLLLSGCADGASSSYTVPDQVCDASATPDALEPLLPPGEEYNDVVDAADDDGGPEHCSISIDGRESLRMTIYLFPDYTDPMEYGVNYGREETRRVEMDGFDAALWPDGILTYVPCFAEREGDRGTHIGLRIEVFHAPIDDDTERAESMREFAGDFIAGLKESKGCEV